MAAKHHTLNAIWPEKLPPLEGAEAVRAARKLIRFGGLKPRRYRYRITSGRRYNNIKYDSEGQVVVVNPERGWRALVHEISHAVFYRKHPGHKSHNFRHATLEANMIRTVLARGWLDGKLKREPKPPAPTDELALRQQQLARLERKIKTLETRKKTCLKKIRALLKKGNSNAVSEGNEGLRSQGTP